VGERDWVEWHREYDDPASRLSQRLAAVQGFVQDALDAGARRVVSLCAGEGRDVLGVVGERPVTGRLVELDPRLAAVARAAAPPGIEVVEADAGDTSSVAGAVPADLVLLCGIFGNVPDGDVERTCRLAPMLCAPGATVIWTRHTSPPDLNASIRRWLAEAGFGDIRFVRPGGTSAGVGVARLVGDPLPFEPGVRLFSFG
jgi:hypothetical protein